MSNTPAVPTNQTVAVPDEVIPGLEDADDADLVTPIWRIDHEKGCFVNGLTGEESTEVEAIILGRKKQRILWPMEIGGEGEQPMCRSFDFNVGFPRPETWVAPQKGNPSLTAVKQSGFDYTQVENAAVEGTGLSCASCPLKEWGKDKTPPWCNEQWTFAFLAKDSDGEYTQPGIISFQRTGLKACKTYVAAFQTAKSALYTVVTKMKAVVQQRGSVKWVVPSFQRLDETDSTKWPDFSMGWTAINQFLSTPRTFSNKEDEDEDDVAAATSTTVTVSTPAPAPVAATAPEPPAPAPEPVAPTPPPEPPQEPAQVVVEAEQVPEPVGRAQPAAVPAAVPAADASFDDEEPF